MKLTKFLCLFCCLSLFNCSFDNKTGIWDGYVVSNRDKREVKLKELNFISNDEDFAQEINTKNKIQIGLPKNVESWISDNLNNQNHLGHLKYDANFSTIIKDKYGKNKFGYLDSKISIITFQDSLLFANKNGSIFNINLDGRIVWKNNIYKKINKKIHKKIFYSYFNNILYFADNLGFVYAINPDSGEIIWIENYKTEFNSSIKIKNSNIYLLTKDNKLFSIKLSDGTVNWILSTENSFIKTNAKLALAITPEEYIYFINSAGNFYKVDKKWGKIVWSIPAIDNIDKFSADFFETSDIVIDGNLAFFSNLFAGTTAVNILNGSFLWRANIKSNLRPIISKQSIYILSSNGYLINLHKNKGNVNWSVNLLSKVKKVSEKDTLNNFILASSKIYVSTKEGYLLVCSAHNGKVEKVLKITKSINNFIISKNHLYILTNKSKLIGLN